MDRLSNEDKTGMGGELYELILKIGFFWKSIIDHASVKIMQHHMCSCNMIISCTSWSQIYCAQVNTRKWPTNQWTPQYNPFEGPSLLTPNFQSKQTQISISITSTPIPTPLDQCWYPIQTSKTKRSMPKRKILQEMNYRLCITAVRLLKTIAITRTAQR